MASIPVLDYHTVTGARNASVNILDTTVDTSWNINLNGTDNNGNPIKAKVIVIDNFGNDGIVSFTYGVTSYKVSPYTRKQIFLVPDQQYIIISADTGAVTVTFCDYNPDLPDDTNQVATNTPGGGGGTFASLDPATRTAGTGLINLNTTLEMFGATSWAKAVSTFGVNSGKIYIETTAIDIYSPGLWQSGFVIAAGLSNSYPGQTTNGLARYTNGLQGAINCTGLPTTNDGDIDAFALNLDYGKFWVRSKVSGTWSGWYGDNGGGGATLVGQNPETNLGGFAMPWFSTIYYMIGIFRNTSGDPTYSATVNFGSTAFDNSAPVGYSGWTA